jgi:hypothetical protein
LGRFKVDNPSVKEVDVLARHQFHHLLDGDGVSG